MTIYKKGIFIINTVYCNKNPTFTVLFELNLLIMLVRIWKWIPCGFVQRQLYTELQIISVNIWHFTFDSSKTDKQICSVMLLYTVNNKVVCQIWDTIMQLCTKNLEHAQIKTYHYHHVYFNNRNSPCDLKRLIYLFSLPW